MENINNRAPSHAEQRKELLGATGPHKQPGTTLEQSIEIPNPQLNEIDTRMARILEAAGKLTSNSR